MELVSRRKVVSTDTSNTGWGALCKGRSGQAAAYKLPGNAGCFSDPQNLPTRPKWTSRLSPVGQHGGSILHKPTGWTQVEASVQASQTSPLLGPMQPALTESDARAGGLSRDSMSAP